MKEPTSGRERWFKIREELSGRRASLLMALSFLLPLAIWCTASYVPFIWPPDIRLEVSADRVDVSRNLFVLFKGLRTLHRFLSLHAGTGVQHTAGGNIR